MTKLILMVGLPRSGKSTRARVLSQTYNAPIVNPDAIRRVICGIDYRQKAEPLVWGVAKTMVMSLFEAGHEMVIVDACNNTRRRRDEWRSGHWILEFQVVDTPDHVCLLRASDANPNLTSVIKRMVAAQEIPDKDEGAVFITKGY